MSDLQTVTQHPLFVQLHEALQNMSGVFDSPVARRKMNISEDTFAAECIQSARDALAAVDRTLTEAQAEVLAEPSQVVDEEWDTASTPVHSPETSIASANDVLDIDFKDALRYAINCESIDARLNMSDNRLADVLSVRMHSRIRARQEKVAILRFIDNPEVQKRIADQMVRKHGYVPRIAEQGLAEFYAEIREIMDHWA